MSFLPTDLIGVTFDTTKRPMFNTEVAEGDGGQSRRNSIQVGRLRWYFKVNYEFIVKVPQGVNELFAFYASLKGSTGSFLYRDPTDNLISASNGTFLPNVADGTTTTAYQVARLPSLAYAFTEMLTDGAWNATFGSDSFQPYVDGVPLAAGHWSSNSTGGVTFSSPSDAPAGAILAWAGNFYFRVQFKAGRKNGLIGAKFMNNYWQHTIEMQSDLSGDLPFVPPPGPALTFIDSVPNVDII